MVYFIELFIIIIISLIINITLDIIETYNIKKINKKLNKIILECRK